jgi:hypothetical protein
MKAAYRAELAMHESLQICKTMKPVINNSQTKFYKNATHRNLDECQNPDNSAEFLF